MRVKSGWFQAELDEDGVWQIDYLPMPGFEQGCCGSEYRPKLDVHPQRIAQLRYLLDMMEAVVAPVAPSSPYRT